MNNNSNDATASDRQVVILGGGPAGLTAAIYAGRSRLEPLVLMGQSYGGQAAATAEMDNYPGFPEGIAGMELMDRIARQAKRFAAELAFDEATAVNLGAWPFIVQAGSATYRAEALIICTGATPRRLGVPGEAKFIGRGVSFCATCDGFFYRDKPVVVVGGGDSAVDEAVYLTRFASQVTVIHRREVLRACPHSQQRAFANPKIRFVWNSVVQEILGEDTVTGVLVRNVVTGEEQRIEAEGVFVYIGLDPNVALFRDQLALTEDGYILTDKRQRTSVPGVFAAGDVQAPYFRQAVIAAGSGAAAAIEAERFLAEREWIAAQKTEEKS